jgi:hypothetical protein
MGLTTIVGLRAAVKNIEQKVISRCPSPFLHIERKAISTPFDYRTAPELEERPRAALANLPECLRIRKLLTRNDVAAIQENCRIVRFQHGGSWRSAKIRPDDAR